MSSQRSYHLLYLLNSIEYRMLSYLSYLDLESGTIAAFQKLASVCSKS